MRCVRATVVVEEQYSNTQPVCVCVCSLRYSERNAHAPYCLLWSARSATFFFSTLSHKRHDFRKIIIEDKMRVSNFFYKFCLKQFFRSKKK